MPYYFIIGACVFACVQYYISASLGYGLDYMGVLNVNKTFFLFSAVAIQTFEWYNTYEMINFQKDYDVTTVAIEKRKFQPVEKRRRNHFFGVIALYFVTCNAACILLALFGALG